MKKLFFIIMTFLFIGCNNSSKDNTLIVPAESDVYNKENIVLFGYIPNFTFLDRYPQTQIISSNDNFEQFVADLNQAPILEEGSNDQGINQEIKTKWLKALNSATVDFTKDNLLILRFTNGPIYDIKIDATEKDKEKKIIFSIADKEKMALMSDAGYFFVYKISKDIENIMIELFPSTQNPRKLTIKNI